MVRVLNDEDEEMIHQDVVESVLLLEIHFSDDIQRKEVKTNKRISRFLCQRLVELQRDWFLGELQGNLSIPNTWRQCNNTNVVHGSIHDLFHAFFPFKASRQSKITAVGKCFGQGIIHLSVLCGIGVEMFGNVVVGFISGVHGSQCIFSLMNGGRLLMMMLDL